MRRLFEGGAYLKGSYHEDKTFWLYNLINLIRHQCNRRVCDTWTTRRWKYSCWPCTELWRLLTFFLQQTLTISSLQQLQGRERGRLGLSYRRSLQPSRKNWRTRKLNERASRYTHFELKNITIDKNKFPLLAYNCVAAITVYFYHLMEILK